MNNEERIPIGEATVLILQHVAGHADIRAGEDGEEREIRVVAGDGLQIDATGDELSLSCQGACTLTMPANLDLRCVAIHGHAQIYGIAGAITGDAVDGRLLLRHTGPVQLRAVGGDLDADDVAGDLIVDKVGGDLRTVDVRGTLATDAGGDIIANGIEGVVRASAGGDARLTFVSLTQAEHSVRAGGDIVCRLPADADVAARLRCGGRVRVYGQIALQPEGAGAVRFVLGDGAAALDLKAGGDIRVGFQYAPGEEMSDDSGIGHEFARQMEQAAQQIAGQLEGQLVALARQLEAKLTESGAGDEIAARVQEKVQAAMRRAENNIANALRHVEKQAQRAEERAARMEARQMRGRPAWPEPPPPPPRPAPISPEQRMKILHMLNQGKITVEQAEQLLSALSGKGTST